MFAESLSIITCFIILISSRACKTLLVIDRENRYELQKLTLVEHESLLRDSPCIDSGRAVYKSKDGLYLYHFHDSPSCMGHWILSASFCAGMNGALSFKETWAVEPELTNSFGVADNAIRSTWTNHAGEGKFQFSCAGRHDSVYFESSPVLQPQLTGFYSARDLAKQSEMEGSSTNTVYVLIKHLATDVATYMFHLPSQLKCNAAEETVQTDGTVTLDSHSQHCELTTTWLIGDRYGVDAGHAYTIVTQIIPFGTTGVPEVPSISAQWKFVQANGNWAVDPAARLISVPPESSTHSDNDISLFEMVQSIRSLRTDFPPGTIVTHYIRNLFLKFVCACLNLSFVPIISTYC